MLGRGDMNLSRLLTLKNVLFVLDLTANLISVAQALDNHSVDSVNFTREFCTFKRGHTIVLRAQRHNDMWQILPKNHQLHFTKTDVSEKLSIVEWHMLLGHVNYGTLFRMIENGTLPSTDSKHTSVPTCWACISGKMTRAPFPISKTKLSSSPGYLTHADLIGPIETQGRKGARFILTLVDDHSRFISAYPIRKKSEAKYVICSYIRKLKDKGHFPRIFRSDNGTEFINATISRMARKNNIDLQMSNRYTPQQNGVAERANRTLIEGARTLLLDNSINKRNWPDAVQAAVRGRNNVISTKISGIPEVLFHGNMNLPKFSFGQRAMVHIPDELRKKFDAKAQQMRYLGPASGKKGLRFLTSNDKIVESRDYEFLPLIEETSLKNHSTITETAHSRDNSIDLSVLPNDDETKPTPLDRYPSENQYKRPTRRQSKIVRFADQHY